MYQDKPESILDLFSEEKKDFPLAYLIAKSDSENIILSLDEESLLNGLLVSYLQGPPEGDPDEFRSYASAVIR